MGRPWTKWHQSVVDMKIEMTLPLLVIRDKRPHLYRLVVVEDVGVNQLM